MVRSDGLAKIVDFGLAKPGMLEQAATAGEADSTVTRAVLSDPGVVMGDGRVHVSGTGQWASGGLAIGSIRAGAPDL